MDDNTRRLSRERYLGTMSGKMRNVTDHAELPDEIWDYAGRLPDTARISEDRLRQRQAEAVYENDERTFRHILLFCDKKNRYAVIVVDMTNGSILGHYLLDLNEEYGLE